MKAGVGFADPLAAEQLERAGHDPGQVLTDRRNVLGAIRRTQALDESTTRVTAARHLASVGAGLCTRHDRVPPTVEWSGVDTADVAAFLPEDRVDVVAADVTTPGWSALLDRDRPTLVFAGFGAGTEVIGDHFHPTVAASDRHPILKATGSVEEVPVMEGLGTGQRVAAKLFHALSRGGHLDAVAHLEVLRT